MEIGAEGHPRVGVRRWDGEGLERRSMLALRDRFGFVFRPYFFSPMTYLGCGMFVSVSEVSVKNLLFFLWHI